MFIGVNFALKKAFPSGTKSLLRTSSVTQASTTHHQCDLLAAALLRYAYRRALFC
jgi:hypothetical protein